MAYLHGVEGFFLTADVIDLCLLLGLMNDLLSNELLNALPKCAYDAIVESTPMVVSVGSS